MDNIEEIKKRFEKGYVMSIYGTSANLHNQMRSDIETLLKALSIHSVSYSLDDMDKQEIDYKKEYNRICQEVAKMLVENRRNYKTPMTPFELLSKWDKIREVK